MQLDSFEVGNIAKALADLDKQQKATGMSVNGEVRISGTGLDVRFNEQTERHVVSIGG